MKVDFKKTLSCYRASKKFELIEVPKLNYLMIDGYGDPNTSKDYQNALTTLYPVAYKLKFASKLNLNKDYVVMPLEGLWWADDMNDFTVNRDKSKWKWKMMIMQPDWITEDMFEQAKQDALAKSPALSLDKLRFEALDEGLAVQILHVGSYDDEAPVLEAMHSEFIPENNLKMTGRHHEIYLSDPRKTAPEKLKTILRQPVDII
jgi:hypothetical protein